MSERTHSKAYHRYFEDYAERQVLDSDGGVRTERVYVGKYYRVKCSDGALRFRRTGFLLLYLAAAGSLLLGGIHTRISSLGIVAVFSSVALIGVLQLAVPIFYRLTVPREMEIRAWRDSSENLLRYSLGAAVCVLLCVAVTLGAVLLLDGWSFPDAAGTPLYVLSAVCCLGIRRMERRTEYEVLPPKHERPGLSSPIRYYSSD